MLITCAPRGALSGSDAVYALLRHTLQAAYGLELPPVKKLDTGKPYFPTRPDIHFSLSHTSTHVLCAVSDAPIGVDVESVRSIRPGVAERVCAPEELESFDFFDLWVLKESFIKVTGNTRVKFKTITFSRTGGEIQTPSKDTAARLYHDIPGCRAAVCAQHSNISSKIEFVDILKITGNS